MMTATKTRPATACMDKGDRLNSEIDMKPPLADVG
jgi:hypothetical protein